MYYNKITILQPSESKIPDLWAVRQLQRMLYLCYSNFQVNLTALVLLASLEMIYYLKHYSNYQWRILTVICFFVNKVGK